MSGLPVSHVGEKVSGGVISTGSPTVHVGSSAVGLADRVSACVPLVGKPVNPMLGSKLLPEEVDFALAAPDTFTFARGYLSSNPRIGRLGRGWWLPGESMHLELSEDACVLVDAQGRRIGFPALAPGAQHYSGSEELWLRRGGSSGGEAQAWRGRWAAVPAELQTQEGSVLVLSGHSYLHFQRCPDGIWRLQASFGRAGYRTEFRWSGRGLLTGVRDSAGRSYALVYQQACEPSEGDDGLRLFGVILASHDGPPPDYIDPQSPGLDWLVRYQFSDSGDLIAVRDRLGQVVRVFAWREHMLVAHGEPGGLEVRYEWDVHAPHGRVVKQIEAGGLTRTFRYLRDATEVSDSLGRVERYEFAGEGGQRRWTALVRADGSRSEFDYDLFGRLVAMRDPLGRETRRRRDGQGRMLEEESPGKARYRKRVDEETGLLVELEDAMQRRWTFERDERGNVTTVRGPAGSTRYAYEDPRLPDRPTRIVDPRGGERRLEWNRFGLLAALTDCSGQVWRYDYDNEGRLVASSDPLGQLTRRRYDPLGQLIGLELADGSALSYEYDALGRQTRIADAEGHATLFSWGHGDLLARVSDAGGGELSYLHDEAGRLVALTNENGVQAQFRYDLLDRLVEETGFDGRRQRYRYNAADELIAREDADGRETTYAYDRDGRLASIRVPATEHAPALVERYRWLADGRLASAGGADCEVRICTARWSVRSSWPSSAMPCTVRCVATPAATGRMTRCSPRSASTRRWDACSAAACVWPAVSTGSAAIATTDLDNWSASTTTSIRRCATNTTSAVACWPAGALARRPAPTATTPPATAWRASASTRARTLARHSPRTNCTAPVSVAPRRARARPAKARRAGPATAWRGSPATAIASMRWATWSSVSAPTASACAWPTTARSAWSI